MAGRPRRRARLARLNGALIGKQAAKYVREAASEFQKVGYTPKQARVIAERFATGGTGIVDAHTASRSPREFAHVVANALEEWAQNAGVILTGPEGLIDNLGEGHDLARAIHLAGPFGPGTSFPPDDPWFDERRWGEDAHGGVFPPDDESEEIEEW